ncbi:MAG: class I SAM-dependent methyltransferase [Pseudomonadota bacterium]
MRLDRTILPVPLKNLTRTLLTTFHAVILTPLNLQRNKAKLVRTLEIGPGLKKIAGFESINVGWSPGVDYIGNASSRLPFRAGTFDVVFASHIIEHLPWYQVEHAIAEWSRILKPGGVLEIWTPDTLKICKAWIRFEDESNTEGMQADGWFRLNAGKEPAKWASGRIYAYGDGQGTLDHPNWHRALFSARYLQLLLQQAGLEDVRTLDVSERRGQGHGWIDLGVTGRKP